MAAAGRFGLRTSHANAGKPASGWGQKAKTLAKTYAVRSAQIQPNDLINSCDIASRVETIMSRRVCGKPTHVQWPRSVLLLQY